MFLIDTCREVIYVDPSEFLHVYLDIFDDLLDVLYFAANVCAHEYINKYSIYVILFI
jgi:hypothetical protein